MSNQSTVVTVNKTGLDYTWPAQHPNSYVGNVNSGYAVFNTFTLQWTGSNLTYSGAYVMPISGTITSIQMQTSKPELIYSLSCEALAKLMCFNSVCWD
jgi:hypothetical protein